MVGTADTPAEIALPAWIRIVRIVAAAKVVLGLAAFLAGPHAPAPPFRTLVFVAHVLTFTGLALFLQTMGRDDRRAVSLGLFFLVAAGTWADRLLEPTIGTLWVLASVAALARHTQLVAFAPYFFWSFVRDFPRRHRVYRRRRTVRRAMAAVLALGAALLATNLALHVLPPHDALASGLWRFDRGAPGALFWPLVFAALLPAMVFAGFQARHAALDEQRRVRLVLGALVLGITPEMALTLLCLVWPWLDRFLATSAGLRFAGAVSYPAMLSIPFILTYAVVVHQALDLRVLARRVVQYAFARSTIMLATALPLLLSLAAVYAERERKVTELISGRTGLWVFCGIGLGVMAWRAQPRLVAALDRIFFREEYDGRMILRALVARIQLLRDQAELATVLRADIDSALHLRRVELLLLHADTGVYRPIDGTLPPLLVSSQIVRQLGAAAPIAVDWTRPAAWLATLPAPEREWLLDAELRLAVPVPGSDNLPAGLICLGEKRSELPFSREDHALLETVAGAVALVLERDAALHQSRRQVAQVDASTVQAASECVACGHVAPALAATCPTCGEPTRPAAVPLLVGGKFHLLQRIGEGGMGIVYRARDLALDREVALKTLPRVTPDEATRLRHEARTMATVSHPNLAAIHGAESWRGTPLLVVEFLPGGTLADRLRGSALAVHEALELGLALAQAIERLHRAGILHRDIKPSNIGFAEDGTPKLLDFGVAHVLESAARHGCGGVAWDSKDARLSSRGELVGTVYYLSPEAVDGERPDPRVDLWALSLVLYEAVTGRHPLVGTPWPAVLLRIVEADFPDVRHFADDLPASLARFFRDALHADPKRRPGSARDLQSRLAALLAEPASASAR